MRILHTADWHIGQTLAGFSRDHEHRAVFGELARIVATRQPDALIVAGDVFDHQNPSGEAQRLFYETLLALRHAAPGMAVVVTAGNHDAAGRLEAPGALLRAMGVHVVGNVRRSEGRIDAARHLLPLRVPSGEIAAHVLAVSYPTAACLPPFDRIEGNGSPIPAATRQLYAELAERSGAGQAGLPFLVTGHLHVAGGEESEGAERPILVGGSHAVPPDVFPAGAAYVALGHLHKPQMVGRPTVRYSGSLLPLSATELYYRHGVTLVSLTADGVTTEQIPVSRPVPFLRLPESGRTRLLDLADRLKALALPNDLPLERQPFLQIRLERAGLPVGFRAEVDRIAGEFPVRVVDIRVPEPEGEAAVAAAEIPMRLADLAPLDLFREAFVRKHGTQPSEAHLRAFHEVAAAAGSAEA
jgi:DNA repair protein SbcD/Mre11